jgi:hypothetical protein
MISTRAKAIINSVARSGNRLFTGLAERERIMRDFCRFNYQERKDLGFPAFFDGEVTAPGRKTRAAED